MTVNTTTTQPISAGVLTAAFAAMALTVNPAAQAQDAPPINSGKVAFSTGFDVTSEYWFRGLGQENEGLILQPWIDVTFELYSSDNLTLTGNVGSWNSIHDSTAGDAWYESDFYAGVSAEMGAIAVGASYINLYNPAGGNIFAEEVDITLDIDATAFDLPAYLSPSFTLAIETDGGSDAGTNKGTYLEIAFEPTIEDVLGSGNAPVTLSIPLTLGLGLDDYYEDGMGNDDTFGFFDIGAVLSTPLDGLIPADYGTWTASVGVHAIFLGDSAENISGAFGTGTDDSSVYVTFGLGMEY
ncbi:MAG: hypothetical protein Kow00105_04860 [Phycisphaeraceae bacterium]